MERNAGLKNNARNLRKNQTKEEALLWYRFLSQYPVRFRRQYIIGDYIADFYCHKAKLVVELDGSQHYEEKERQYDEQRTAYFHSLGIAVLCFSNLDVLREFDNVCSMIHSTVALRTHTFPWGKRSAVAVVNDSPVGCQSLDRAARRRRCPQRGGGRGTAK